MIQAHIFYSGTVQGVGFRYAVERYASELGLTGWIKNLRDGRVEILTEGKKELIEKLIVQVDKYFGGYVRNKTVDYKEAQNLYKEFRISF